MRSAWLAIGVLVISVASAQTPSNKQEQVPTAILLNSRYVYVEAWAGDFFNPHLLPEDRKAILDVQNALQDTDIWSRSNGATPKFTLTGTASMEHRRVIVVFWCSSEAYLG